MAFDPQLAYERARSDAPPCAPKLRSNLERERTSVRGRVHLGNVERWQDLIERRDLRGLRQVMTGLDRDSIEMREVSPMGGLLPDVERLEVLRGLERPGSSVVE